MTTNFYRGAEGALLVYDITDQKSFDDIKMWLKAVQDNTYSDIENIIIGNKCDKEDVRIVEKETGEIMAKQNDCLFFETSAKSGSNIDHCFATLAHHIVAHQLVIDNYRGIIDDLQPNTGNTHSNNKQCCGT